MIPTLFPRSTLWAASLAAASLAAGCSSSSSDTAATKGDVTILHSASPDNSTTQEGEMAAAAVTTDTNAIQAPAAFPSGVDSMHIEFKDASGQLLYGPIE